MSSVNKPSKRSAQATNWSFWDNLGTKSDVFKRYFLTKDYPANNVLVEKRINTKWGILLNDPERRRFPEIQFLWCFNISEIL